MMHPPPEGGDLPQVEIPVELFRGLPESQEPLGVGEDFRPQHRLLQTLQELVSAPINEGSGAGQFFGCRHPLTLQGGKQPGENRLPHEGYRNPHIEALDDAPFARALLPRRIEDLPNQEISRFLSVGEDVPGDFHKIAFQFGTVPPVKHFRPFLGGHP